MTQFKLPTNHRVFLEEEIYVKLVAAAESKAEDYNKMWAKREQEGKTYHTRTTFSGTERVYWYGETKGFLNITFFQEDSYGQMANDYYRPWYCKVNFI